MKNIIKAQLYQLRRSSLLRTLFISFMVLTAYFVYGVWANGDNITDGVKLGGIPVTSGDLLMQLLGVLPTFFVMLVAIVTGYICGDDFGDKTMNYEMSSGVLRKDIYFGRAVTAAVCGTLSGVFMMLFTIVCCCIAAESGALFSMTDMVIRVLFMGFVFLRLCCFYIMLSYMIKKTVAVLALAYVIMSFISVLGEFLSPAGKYFTAMTSLSTLTNMDCWYTFEVSGVERNVCQTALAVSDGLTVTAVSLIFSAVYLTVGYLFFRRDDMN